MKTRIKIDSAILSFTIILTGFLYQFPNLFSSSKLMDNVWDFTGVIFILKGTMIRMIARGYKKANSKNGKALVVGGIYQLVRNPMYLGSFYLGLGFVLILWPVWTVPIYAGLFYLRFRPQVLAEEKLLGSMFGAEYGDYCRRVPRVFPRLDQMFNVRVREIVNFDQALSTKDKYGLIAWPVMALVLEGLHEKFVFGTTNVKDTLLIFLSAIVVYGAALMIRYYKSA